MCVLGVCLRQSIRHSTSCGCPTASGLEPGGGGGGGGRGHCRGQLGPAVLAVAAEDAEAAAGCWLLLLACAVLRPRAAWLAA